LATLKKDYTEMLNNYNHVDRSRMNLEEDKKSLIKKNEVLQNTIDESKSQKMIEDFNQK
jgi:hypothetical protein